MSYILQALKKVEEERQRAASPALESNQRSTSVQRGSLWLPLATIGLLLNAGVLGLLLRQPSFEVDAETDEPGTNGAVPFDPARRSTGKAPDAQEVDANADTGGQASLPAPSGPAEPFAAWGRRENNRSVIPPAVREDQSLLPPANAQQMEAISASSEAGGDLLPQQRAGILPSAAFGHAAEGVAARETGDVLINTNGQQLDSVQPTGAKTSLAVPAKTVPTRPENSVPLLDEMPVEFRTALPSMHIDLLAYYDDPAGRMVLINRRRYTEGELVEGKLKLEEIIHSGVILSFAGQRFLLRP